MRRWTRPLPAEPDRAILSHIWTTSTCYKPREIERRRQQAPACFGDAEHDLGCGQAEVTHLSDGPATGHGIGVDGGNEGFPGPGKEAERIAPQAIAGACLDACSIIGCPLFEVAAGAKRSSCPSDNRHPRRVVLVIMPQ